MLSMLIMKNKTLPSPLRSSAGSGRSMQEAQKQQRGREGVVEERERETEREGCGRGGQPIERERARERGMDRGRERRRE